MSEALAVFYDLTTWSGLYLSRVFVLICTFDLMAHSIRTASCLSVVSYYGADCFGEIFAKVHCDYCKLPRLRPRPAELSLSQT